MRIEGYIYQQKSVARQIAAIIVDGGYFTLYIDNKKILKDTIDNLNIPSRIGNTSRKIQINETDLFETMDNDSVDQFFIKGKSNKNWVHALENKWLIAIPAIFIGIAFTGSLIVWGIPFTAEKIAYAMPESINEKISKGTFETIDRLMLSPSELPIEKQKVITKEFSTLVNNYSTSHFNYRLHFRHMSGEPNAFALPDGNIVVTDTLVEYADEEINEVLAVLLHEIGHVEHRHGLRLALEASSIALIISMITGDLAASDDLLVTLPTILSTSAFSRQHEEEADEYAFKYMQKAKLDPIHFARIMAKITHAQYDKKGDTTESNNTNQQDLENNDNKTKNRIEKTIGYLSSHPITEERIHRAELASVQFNQESSTNKNINNNPNNKIKME